MSDAKEVNKGYVVLDKDGEIEEHYSFKNRKDWHEALQESPNADMTMSRSLGSGKNSVYVPITIQEAMADVFFLECDIIEEKIEIYNHVVGKEHNSQIILHLKLQILPNYPHSEHRVISGIASKMIQQKKTSLEYNSPAAQSSAKSNALTNFANIFGRNLNRNFNNNYSFTRKK